MEKPIVKEYEKGDLTVVWKPDLCIHSAKCVSGLPEVFDTSQRPWVDMDGADKDAIIKQVNHCPTGALSYRLSNEKRNTNMEQPNNDATTRIEVLKKGPLIVHSTCCIVDADGNETIKENRVSLCRCGASSNKPYCDGTHRGIEFE